MPAEILLPLFAVTLLANAILVGVAIRGMRRGHQERDRSAPNDFLVRRHGTVRTAARGVEPPATPTKRVEPATTVQRVAPIEPGEAPPATPTKRVEPATTVQRVAPIEPGEAPPGKAPVEPTIETQTATADVTPVNQPSRVAPLNARTRAGAEPSRGPGNPRPRGRRRFALPPLGDDDERVSRSIESFLGGSEGPVDARPTPAIPDGSPDGPTTVALVTIEGLSRKPARRSVRRTTGKAETDAPAEMDAPAVLDPQAMVERTLRGAARGSDVVSVDRQGRFRVVLPATGELAARAYLRRIRASVEPLLEASDDPLTLVVATATVLDGTTRDAIRLADARLAALLEGARPARAELRSRPDAGEIGVGRDDGTADPRAAGD